MLPQGQHIRCRRRSKKRSQLCVVNGRGANGHARVGHRLFRSRYSPFDLSRMIRWLVVMATGALGSRSFFTGIIESDNIARRATLVGKSRICVAQNLELDMK